MKPAGVVRKVDQLGRIVLPKSLRKRYQMNEGGSMDSVSEFKERYICSQCMTDMTHLTR